MPEKSPRQPRKPFQNTGNRKPVRKSSEDSRKTGAVKRESGVGGRRPSDNRKKFSREDERQSGAGKRPYRKRTEGEAYPQRSERRSEEGKRPAADGERRTANRKRPAADGERKTANRKRPAAFGERPAVKPLSPGKYPKRRGVTFKPNAEKDGIRLNKYVANAGICSRREADELIQAGVIKVNDVVVTALGTKVMPGDKVQYGDQTISNEKKRYLLLNKQKGYVTTTKDPHAKNTVMELIEGACKERIYPVGRLDRNTTGLLLFTNDGDLAKKLMHPSSRINKMYHVVLDQPVSKADMLKIADGIALDDEKVRVDSIAYVEDAKDRREVGLELHSGQNRVVRRIFESLGYKVTKLDRVVYAGLTKRGIPRGKWRFLNEQEVIRLKMLR